MRKVCAVFLIVVLTAGCEKLITYHHNIWSDNISKYCNLKGNNRDKEYILTVNNNFNQEHQKQRKENSLDNNKESVKNSSVGKIESINAQKKNDGASKAGFLEASILKLNQVLNKNSKQSELARQEGQTNDFLNEVKKTDSGKVANNKNPSEEKKNITKNNASKNGVNNKDNKNIDLTKQNNKNNNSNNLKESGNNMNSLNDAKVDNLNTSIATKKNKEVLKNDTKEFNSVKKRV